MSVLLLWSLLPLSCSAVFSLVGPYAAADLGKMAGELLIIS
jgi:hypothetical protein